MQESKHIQLFKRLFTAIYQLFDHEEFANAKTIELEDIFYKNLSAILQHSFDLQVSKEKLTAFASQQANQTDEQALAQFIVDAIETDKTYILLNYYLCQFIQRYYEIVKEDKITEVEQIILRQGLTAEDLQFAIDQYQQLTAKEKVAPQSFA